MFRHVVGSRVSQGLFDSYRLPSGKSVHYHYSSGSIVNEHAISKLPPPSRPISIPTALQRGMPVTHVLDIIAKPPGSGAAVAPYRCVPRLALPPSQHTLHVKHPDSSHPSSFGDLREENLAFCIEVKEIRETRVSTKLEKIDRANKKPWTLPSSIFKPRIRESDARDFYDTPKVMNKSFEKDWERCIKKEKFASMLFREAKAIRYDPSLAVEGVRECIKRHYWTLCSAFLYFAATGSGDLFHVSLNAFTAFLDDCSIVDSGIKRSDCDTVFIVANFATDKKTPEYAHNNEQALMRFEFMEALVRIALLKYIKSGEVRNLEEAVEKLFVENIQSHLSPSMCVAPNAFREHRLYREDVDALLKQHQILLKAIYSRYRMKPAAGGLRFKVMKVDGWLLFMEETQLIDAQFTLLDAQLCYLRSRMWVQDEIMDYTRYESLSFVDFLEALGRAAELKALPNRMEMEQQGYHNIFEWFRGRDGGSEGISIQSQTRETPLSEKLDVALDFVFRSLHYDPAQPDSAFSREALLKMIRKKDKEMGP